MPILARYPRRYVIFAALLAVAFTTVALVLTFWHPGPQATATPEIRISYSSSYTNTIDGGLQPSSGRTFLVIHLTVENLGYQNFTANPFRDMYVVVNGQSYNVSAAYIFLSTPFLISNLNNTNSAAGDVVFEVPQGSTSFTPGWRVLSTSGIRLDWVAS